MWFDSCHLWTKPSSISSERMLSTLCFGVSSVFCVVVMILQDFKLNYDTISTCYVGFLLSFQSNAQFSYGRGFLKCINVTCFCTVIYSNNNTVLSPLYRSSGVFWHLQLRIRAFCWYKFYYPHALACGNQCTWIRQTMLEFSPTVLSYITKDIRLTRNAELDIY